MPLIYESSYKPPFLFANGHIQSILPVLCRKVRGVSYTRERFETPDNDFMDLDWSKRGSDTLVIILHGLEGNSCRAYALGMIKICNKNGFDAVALNFRGCSGEPNRLLRSYHHGVSDDLHLVINHILANNSYETVSLVGFSLGGNVITKYLGENKFPLPPVIKKAVVISTPFDLRSCALKLAEKSNTFYMKRFLLMLRSKIRAKMAIMPDKINDHNFEDIRTFKQFDDRYTAPIHGFKNAEDYWEKCTTKHLIKNIQVPTLAINAQNDPFLTEKCFPFQDAEKSTSFFFEAPKSGGHCGFMAFNPEAEYWHETRTMIFLTGN